MTMKPTLDTLGEPFIDSVMPSRMTEDRLNKRLAETESYICAWLVLHQRTQPLNTDWLVQLDELIEYYGELWDENWTR